VFAGEVGKLRHGLDEVGELDDVPRGLFDAD